MRSASPAFIQWLQTSVAPIAHSHGLKGKGPVFRKRVGSNWIVFAIERRHLDPQEAAARGNDPNIEFRIHVGLSVPATRPSWDDRRRALPGIRDITLYGRSATLQPHDREWWHVFDANDPAGQVQLTEVIRDGLGEALSDLGRADARHVLDMRLPFVGPLENLAPGHAEELLALAIEAGDAELHQRIVDALKRDTVPDPAHEEAQRAIEAMTDLMTDTFGPGSVHVLMPPADDPLRAPVRPGRRLRRTKEKLLGDVASERGDGGLAAINLGGWDGDREVVEALRGALGNPHRYTGLVAARSLGQLADADMSTWRTVLALADDAGAGPSELGEAIVLLARLDLPSRAGEAVATLDGMTERYPAWTRRLQALAGLLRASG